MHLRDHDIPCEHALEMDEESVWRRGHFISNRLITGDWCPGGAAVVVDHEAAVSYVLEVTEQRYFSGGVMASKYQADQLVRHILKRALRGVGYEHGSWCVQSEGGDTADPFVHGFGCYRDETPSDNVPSEDTA